MVAEGEPTSEEVGTEHEERADSEEAPWLVVKLWEEGGGADAPEREESMPEEGGWDSLESSVKYSKGKAACRRLREGKDINK